MAYGMKRSLATHACFRSVLIKFSCALTIAFPFSSFGASECYPEPDKDITLFFSNGMFNDISSAQKSLARLKKEAHSSFTNYELSYNTNESIIKQTIEAFYQKNSSYQKFLWSYFSELSGPKWFTDLAVKASSEITEHDYIADEDLRDHVQTYEKFLRQKFKLFVVAHSQGNFYANKSFEFLTQKFSNRDLSKTMKILSVATPSSYVAGGGDYRTLESDYLIRAIPRAMPANISNINPGLIDHEFIKHYLDGSPSGEQIRALIYKSFSDKLAAKYYFKPGYLSNELNHMNEWVKKLHAKKITRRLQKYECLAVSLFLKVENWHGVSCEERNLNEIREGAKLCLEEEWSRPNQFAFSCQLKGLPLNNLSPWRSPWDEETILGSRKECHWKVGEVHKILTQDFLERALNFIKFPE